MIMSVFERTAEMGILHGVGWQRRRIVMLVLCESILLSLVGSVLGAAWAMCLVALISQLPLVVGLIPGMISWSVIVQGLCLGLLVGSLAGIYPAIRAARMTPTEAIRHD